MRPSGSTHLFGRHARLGLPGTRSWTCQPEIFTERLSGIVCLEEPALLQFRHHVFDEIGITTGYVGRGDHETITGVRNERLFQLISDLLWPAHHRVSGL